MRNIIIVFCIVALCCGCSSQGDLSNNDHINGSTSSSLESKNDNVVYISEDQIFLTPTIIDIATEFQNVRRTSIDEFEFGHLRFFDDSFEGIPIGNYNYTYISDVKASIDGTPIPDFNFDSIDQVATTLIVLPPYPFESNVDDYKLNIKYRIIDIHQHITAISKQVQVDNNELLVTVTYLKEKITPCKNSECTHQHIEYRYESEEKVDKGYIYITIQCDDETINIDAGIIEFLIEGAETLKLFLIELDNLNNQYVLEEVI